MAQLAASRGGQKISQRKAAHRRAIYAAVTQSISPRPLPPRLAPTGPAPLSVGQKAHLSLSRPRIRVLCGRPAVGPLPLAFVGRLCFATFDVALFCRKVLTPIFVPTVFVHRSFARKASVTTGFSSRQVGRGTRPQRADHPLGQKYILAQPSKPRGILRRIIAASFLS